ncbi:MAG: winged helix-turn-helix transcriptional regulator [Candidatus Bathyarchaeota archaeon]
MENRYRKYNAVMIVCFLFGGFTIILYMLQVYSILWQNETVMGVSRSGDVFMIPVFSRDLNQGNLSREINQSDPPRRPLTFANPYSLLFSPFSITLLISGIIFIVAGFSIMKLVREKEITFTKKSIIDVFLLPDEKKVLNEIEKYGGSLTQSEIVKSTGFSRVKVHRIIRNLEKKNLIMKHQYGMTNKIVLKR